MALTLFGAWKQGKAELTGYRLDKGEIVLQFKKTQPFILHDKNLKKVL